MSKISNRVYKLKHAPTKVGKNVRFYDGSASTDDLGAGDSFYIHDFIDESQADDLFRQILNEVDFVQMFNVSASREQVFPIPRMVSAQTSKECESSALYRMPGCNQANIATTHWSESVHALCEKAEARINSKLNHCVCTLFRDHHDSLGFHTDKQLDLDEQSLILSISFGAVRPILINEVQGLRKHTVLLQPGSLLAIGPETNRLFEHAIPKLKDPVGPRISLSVRHCKTYIDESTAKIVGQGNGHQDKNYPFIPSHDDLSAFPVDVRQKIEVSCNDSVRRLRDLRLSYEVCDSPSN